MKLRFSFSYFILLGTILPFGSTNLHRSRTKQDNFNALVLEHHHLDDLHNSKDIWGRKDELDNEIEDFTDDPKNLRLPLEVIPLHYFLEITPILEENSNLGKLWTAPGNVKILVEAMKPSQIVTLHAVRLEILKVKIINRSTGKNIKVVQHAQSALREDQYVITLKDELVVGEKYEISLDFVAPVSRNHPDGLYRSQYVDPATKNVSYLASTQFEFFSARQAFPGFDEPALKTPFDISIGRSSKFHSLSNSNLISTRPLKGSPGWFIDSFNTTVNMSTYLVALVVSDFTFSEADSSIFNGKPVRVYGPKYLMDQGAGEFGANVSAQALAFYEKYFELEYPLPKMDSGKYG